MAVTASSVPFKRPHSGATLARYSSSRDRKRVSGGGENDSSVVQSPAPRLKQSLRDQAK